MLLKYLTILNASGWISRFTTFLVASMEPKSDLYRCYIFAYTFKVSIVRFWYISLCP